MVGFFAPRLFDTCCGLVFVGHGLDYTCFGQVCKGLVLFSAADHIKRPFGTLFYVNLAFLGQLAKLGDFGLVFMPNEVYFDWCI